MADAVAEHAADLGATRDEGNSATSSTVGIILQKLVVEYEIERSETTQLRAELASLSAQHESLMSVLNEHQKSLCVEKFGAPSGLQAAERDLPDGEPGGATAQTRRPPRPSLPPALQSEPTFPLPLTLAAPQLPGQPMDDDPLRELASSRTTSNSMKAVAGTFKMRAEWSSDDSGIDSVCTPTLTPSFTDDTLNYTKTKVQYDGILRLVISHPSSHLRLWWGAASCLLVMYDLLIIPLEVFQPEETPFMVFMNWFSLSLWTVDMLCAPFMGYMVKGVPEMRPHKVFDHYFRSGRWTMDIAMVLPDWIFTLLTFNNSSPGSSFKLLRIFRVTRTMRLMRLNRFKYIIAAINDMIDSEYVNISMRIIYMLLSLVAINHFLACGWYAAAEYLSPRDANTWVKIHGFEHDQWPYKYATSFHWAITQFTPSSMHVQPQNMVERWFAIIVVVFGLVVFSYIVGSISAALMKIRGMKEENAHEFWNLKRYLKQNSVPQGLRIRILRNGEHSLQLQRDRVRIEHNKIYKILSEQLQSELSSAIAAPFLAIHPFFKHLLGLPGASMRRLVYNTVSYLHIGQGETIFYAGETATHMFVIVEGHLNYKSKMGFMKSEVVDAKEDWVAEPVLWMAVWRHLGSLMAMSECKVARVSAASFVTASLYTPQALRHAKHYACEFVAWMNGLEQHDLSDVGQGELISTALEEFIPADEAA